MKLRELFNGLEPGAPQIVNNMTIIPLIETEARYEGIAGVENVGLARDDNYNTLHLKPIRKTLTIVPSGFTYITKENAQDRTTKGVGVIEEGSQKLDAYCVQSFQCGHMTEGGQDKREVHLLPLVIRHEAFRAKTGYSRLWGNLKKFNQTVGVTGDFLVSFFRDQAEALDGFIAQFEPVPKQRGAIVLINGKVAGIDLFPNPRSFLDVWNHLIRDCYGSQALSKAKTDPWTPPKASYENVNSADELLAAVKSQIQQEKEWAYSIARACLDQDCDQTGQQTIDTLQIGKVRYIKALTPELEGEVVFSDQDEALYVSLFRHTEKIEKRVSSFAI